MKVELLITIGLIIGFVLVLNFALCKLSSQLSRDEERRMLVTTNEAKLNNDVKEEE